MVVYAFPGLPSRERKEIASPGTLADDSSEPITELENPFAKLVSEGQELSGEEKKVVDSVEEVRDGAVYMWKKFEDGSEDIDNPEILRANASDRESVSEEIKEIRKSWGLEN